LAPASRCARDLRRPRRAWCRRHLEEASTRGSRVGLTPQTDDPDLAATWFDRYEGADLDGVIAKQADQPYVEGKRVMMKIKHDRTVDCVVSGYRSYAAGPGVGSLLLGLYDGEGTLHFVGHTSSFNAAERREVLEKVQAFEGETGFGHGRIPGGPSRWTGGKDLAWTALQPELVCEVAFTQLLGNRFRHAARFLRWRPDKSPADCCFDQLEPVEACGLGEVLAWPPLDEGARGGSTRK